MRKDDDDDDQVGQRVNKSEREQTDADDEEAFRTPPGLLVLRQFLHLLEVQIHPVEVNTSQRTVRQKSLIELNNICSNPSTFTSVAYSTSMILLSTGLPSFSFS